MVLNTGAAWTNDDMVLPGWCELHDNRWDIEDDEDEDGLDVTDEKPDIWWKETYSLVCFLLFTVLLLLVMVIGTTVMEILQTRAPANNTETENNIPQRAIVKVGSRMASK